MTPDTLLFGEEGFWAEAQLLLSLPETEST